ncbi:hypothetical protein A2U01_0095445, partial [Trifolium medium]|nr:hypothetical protein [Trifolium medium]
MDVSIPTSMVLGSSIFSAGTEKVPKACYDGTDTDVPPHVGVHCCQQLLGCCFTCLISVMTTIVVNLTL